MLTGQVKQLIWIQTGIIDAEAVPLSNYRQKLITQTIEAFQYYYFM